VRDGVSDVALILDNEVSVPMPFRHVRHHHLAS
jgi:hypothetical protein